MTIDWAFRLQFSSLIVQIASNLLSLNTQRHLETSTNGMSQVLTRLSSGLRINTAKDDAAGLAISTRMDAVIRGERQAMRNMNDGVSYLQVAEGTMSTIADSVQRIRELAVQAANGSLSGSDRAALQTEANQLLQGISTQAQQAQFNGQTIFAQSDASLGGDPARRGIVDGLRMGWLEEAEQRIAKLYGIKADGADLSIVFEPPAGSGLTSAPGGAAAAVGSLTGTADANGKTLNMFLYIDPEDFKPPNLPNGGGINDGNSVAYSDAIIAHEMVHAIMGRSMSFASMQSWFKEGMAEFIRGAEGRVWGDTAGGTNVAGALAAFNADDVSGSAGYSGGYLAVRYMHQQIKAAGGTGVKDVMTYLSTHANSTLDQALTNASHGAFSNLADFSTKFNTNAATFLSSLNLTNDDTGAIGGSDVDGAQVYTASGVFSDVGSKFDNQPLSGFNTVWQAGTIGVNSSGGTGNKAVSFQAGTKAEQTLTLQLGGMSAKNLGIDDIDLGKLATIAIVHLDDALNYINEQRANIGSMTSRLTAAIDNAQNSATNTSAALSRVRDTDYAQETATLTRQQILQQAGTAMLAQANSMPQLVMALIKG